MVREYDYDQPPAIERETIMPQVEETAIRSASTSAVAEQTSGTYEAIESVTPNIREQHRVLHTVEDSDDEVTI